MLIASVLPPHVRGPVRVSPQSRSQHRYSFISPRRQIRFGFHPSRKYHNRLVHVQSFRGNRVTKIGNLEVEDDGGTLIIRAGKGFEFKVAKNEAWKYVVPVVGLAIVGITGAIFIGPLIFGFLFTGGIFLAGVSAFSAILVAMLVIPISAVVLVSATSALGTALSVAATIGTIALLGYGATLLFSSGKKEEEEVPEQNKEIEEPKKEEWVVEMEEMKENINKDLQNFDERLKKSDSKRGKS